MNAPVIDLAKQHFVVHRGELTGIGTWVKTDGRWRACMAIIRVGDELDERCLPCIVTVDNAWLWSEEVGDPRRTAHIVVAFLKALRLDEFDPKVHFRLISFIQDHLGDLLAIPPRPAETGPAIADVTVTERETGRTREVELSADV